MPESESATIPQTMPFMFIRIFASCKLPQLKMKTKPFPFNLICMNDSNDDDETPRGKKGESELTSHDLLDTEEAVSGFLSLAPGATIIEL